jgi:outer membrane protein TolC
VSAALALLAALGGAPVHASADTLPVISLAEALRQAVQVDPSYVQVVGTLENAEWARRAALLVFVLPTVNTTADYQELSTSQFNIGTGQPATAIGRASIDARYELFTGGRKLQGSRQAAAELEAARAGELGGRFLTALNTERDFYAVLGARELLDVARQRLVRATEQFALARSRVQSGATVQSDSLQLLLEVQRAQVDVLGREAALTVARLQLGRRIGSGGPVDAAPLDVAPPAALALDLETAVRVAVEQGPRWRQARAQERAAEAALKARRGSYLPTVALTAAYSVFDDRFFPSGTTRSSVGINISLPLWDGAQRELAIERLGTARDVARVVREDVERAARRDVTEAYTAFDVARETLRIAGTGVLVAEEILRVQDARYRAGANTVLELLDAQSQLVTSQAELVQARYNVRLARAALEAILGRRLTSASDSSQP